MRKFFWVFLLHNVVVIVSGQSVLTVESAIQLYRDRNPALQAQREDVEASRGRLLQSSLLPNPQLNFSMEGFPFGSEQDSIFFKDQEFLLWANQKIELGGKRGHRREVAQADVELNQARIEELEHRHIARLKEAYLQAHFARRKADLARQQLDLFHRIRDIHQKRREAGDVSGLSQLRIELEEVRFLKALNQTRTDFNSAWSRLAAMIRWSELEPPELRWRGESAPVGASLQELEDLSEESRPDLRVREILVERAGRRVSLENAQEIPDLTLGGGYKRDFGINSYYAAASLPLPLFDRNQGAIAAAEAALRSAQNQLLWKRLQVHAEVKGAYRDYKEQKENFDLLQGEVLQKAEEVLEVTRQSYQEGEADLIDYLDALRTSLDTRLLYHDLLQQLHEARLRLEAAVGGDWN